MEKQIFNRTCLAQPAFWEFACRVRCASPQLTGIQDVTQIQKTLTNWNTTQIQAKTAEERMATRTCGTVWAEH